MNLHLLKERKGLIRPGIYKCARHLVVVGYLSHYGVRQVLQPTYTLVGDHWQLSYSTIDSIGAKYISNSTTSTKDDDGECL